MIPVVLAGAAIVKTAYDMHQSSQMDERAEKRSVKAMTLMAESKVEREEMEKKVKASLLKLANRKKAILQTSMVSFLNVYTRIKKVNFIESDGIKELDSITPELLKETEYSVSVAKESMSEAEAIVSMSLMGMGISVAGAMAGGVSLGAGAIAARGCGSSSNCDNGFFRVSNCWRIIDCWRFCQCGYFRLNKERFGEESKFCKNICEAGRNGTDTEPDNQLIL